MILYIILIVILFLVNLALSSVILYNNNNKENFDDTQCQTNMFNSWNIKNCSNPIWSSQNGLASIYFPAAQECLNGKCYCRSSYKFGKSPWGTNCCLDSNGICSDDFYNIKYDPNNKDNIYGKKANIGDKCSSDIDCSQIQLTNESSYTNGYPTAKYLDNLRCDKNSNQCADINSLYI